MGKREKISICVTGSRTGKTSLISRVVSGAFPSSTSSNTQSTSFPIKIIFLAKVSSKTLKIQGKKVDLEFFDLPGDINYAKTFGTFFTKADCFMICFALNDHQSFDSVTFFFEKIRSSLEQHKIYDIPPIMLVGTKSDLAKGGGRKVPPEEGSNLAKNIGANYIETCAQSGKNVLKLIEKTVTKTREFKIKLQNPSASQDNATLSPLLPRKSPKLSKKSANRLSMGIGSGGRSMSTQDFSPSDSKFSSATMRVKPTTPKKASKPVLLQNYGETGWTAWQIPDSGKVYFYHKPTKNRQWKKPDELSSYSDPVASKTTLTRQGSTSSIGSSGSSNSPRGSSSPLNSAANSTGALRSLTLSPAKSAPVINPPRPKKSRIFGDSGWIEYFFNGKYYYNHKAKSLRQWDMPDDVKTFIAQHPDDIVVPENTSLSITSVLDDNPKPAKGSSARLGGRRGYSTMATRTNRASWSPGSFEAANPRTAKPIPANATPSRDAVTGKNNQIYAPGCDRPLGKEILSGELLKIASGAFGGWQKRWLVLFQHGYILYYKNAAAAEADIASSAPQGIFNLQNGDVDLYSEVSERMKSKADKYSDSPEAAAADSDFLKWKDILDLKIDPRKKPFVIVLHLPKSSRTLIPLDAQNGENYYKFRESIWKVCHGHRTFAVYMEMLCNRSRLQTLDHYNESGAFGKSNALLLSDPRFPIKRSIPLLVTEAINLIESNDLYMKSQGLYRISGNREGLNRMMEKIDRNENSCAHFARDIAAGKYDIHVVSGLLKQFLRDLRDPLIPHKFYDTFIEACRNADQMDKVTEEADFIPYQNLANVLKTLVITIPYENYCTLKFLIQHLCKVATYSGINMMTENNLAIVIGPNILREPQVAQSPEQALKLSEAVDGFLQLSLVKFAERSIETMIRKYDTIFKNNPHPDTPLSKKKSSSTKSAT